MVVGERIRTKIHPQSSKTWTQGTVLQKETDRSYIINADGRNYRRNRFHIRNSKELHPDQPVAESELDLTLVPKRDHDGLAAVSSSKSRRAPVKTEKRMHRTPRNINRTPVPTATATNRDNSDQQTLTSRRPGRQAATRLNPKYKDFVVSLE